MPRKGPKSLPRLPASAFEGPNTGTSDKFPLAPSPSAIHPDSVVDAHAGPDLASWKTEMGQVLGGRIAGIVVVLRESDDVQATLTRLDTSAEPLVAIAVPFKLDAPPPTSLPSSKKWPRSLSTTYAAASPDAIAASRWALQNARAVDIDVRCDITKEDGEWEGFEDFLTKATADLTQTTPIVLSNVLPPPCDLALPIMKLLNAPSYMAYQTHVASLSLHPNLCFKFLPPSWNTPVPTSEADKEKKEWKKRIQMYLGPVLEAFGYERIIFGSSSRGADADAGAWYELARESLAELAVDQEVIDGVFFGNAKRVYGV